MDNFMNVPELISATENNIIEEYKRYKDVKHVAKVFDISAQEVNNILKQVGIKSRNKNI